MDRPDTFAFEGRPTGAEFRKVCFETAGYLGRVVESTYGPYGMDKLLVDAWGDMSATNSGSRVLEMIDVDNPVAELLVEDCNLSEESGDGSTFAVILMAALLAEAETLLDRGLAPVTVVDGYTTAAEHARRALGDVAVDVTPDRTEAYALARTATAGRFTETDREHIRRVVLDVVDVLEPDCVSIDALEFEEDIRLGVDSTRTVQGAVVRSDVVDETMPQDVADASVLLLEEGIVPPRDRGDEETRVTVEAPTDYEAFLDHEQAAVARQADCVVDLGVDVVASQGHLHGPVVDRLRQADVLTIHELKDETFDRLRRAVGGETAISGEIPGTTLGRAGRITVTEIGAGSTPGIVFADCDTTEIATVVVNGGTTRVTAEARRAITQGVAAVAAAYEDPRVVPGGGAVEIEAARRVRDHIESGPASLAVGAFADALLAPVARLIKNAGYDPFDTVATLRTRHDDGQVDAGVDIETGGPMRAYERGVIEPVLVKRHAIQAATDAATTVLRIDGIVPMQGDGDAIGSGPGDGTDPEDAPDLSSGSMSGIGLG